MKNDEALKIAGGLIEKLSPACTQIRVAGSVRRGKPEVHDIEIVAIPDLTPMPFPKPIFGQKNIVIHRTMLDQALYEMKDSFILEKGGDRYKRFYMKKENISIDLFLVIPPAQWGVLFVVRTGPGDFSHWMVTRESLGGALPDQYIVQDGVVGQRVKAKRGYERMGEISMPIEEDFFRLCGLEWMEPGQREARWKR